MSLIRYPPPICRYEDVKSAGSPKTKRGLLPESLVDPTDLFIAKYVKQTLGHVASPSGPEIAIRIQWMNLLPPYRPLTKWKKIFRKRVMQKQAANYKDLEGLRDLQQKS